MAATFSNSRLSALPCELMRGCSFAEDFITLTRIADNHGTDTGTGNAADHGLTTDGNGYIAYDIVPQPSSFSVVVQFSRSSLSSGVEHLIYNGDFPAGGGFEISIHGDYVRGNHSDGVLLPTRCQVQVDYSDGEIHTITYVVDMAGGNHYLYVDALDVVSQSTSVNSKIGDVNAINVASRAGTYNYTGTIHKARVFDAILTESEHDVYHAGTLTSFMNQSLAVYRCDDICNDTDGNKIWDRTLNLSDLYKADRTTTAAFPRFDTDKYRFDLVDDYVSNWPTLPATYTVVAALSTPQLPYPVITQENDSTLITSLSTGGDHWGFLHNLAIHTGVLTQLQLYHTEYMHLYNLWRGRAYGTYHRLITEDVCQLAMFMDAGNKVFNDYSPNLAAGVATLVTRDGANGCSFGSATSNVTFDHIAGLQCEAVSIVVFLTGVTGVSSTLVDKGTNYKLRTTATHIDFNGSTIAHVVAAGDHQIAVTCKPGFKPRFYVNKAYIGEGSTTETPDDTDTTDLVIGNNNELNERCQHTLKQICICNKALTDAEIRALGEQAQIIGATAMETGNRIRSRTAVTGTALDVDVDPGGAFQLLWVEVEFNTAVTVTNEDLTIGLLNSDTDDYPLRVWDPKVTGGVNFRFVPSEPRVENGATITVDYTNTDAKNIVCNVCYQIDQEIP
jgi:hypothetical protein